MARVLIVDDDPGTVQTFALILKLATHTSSVAVTGAEGLSLAMTNQHDVILVDLRLPDISGLEFLAELRSTSAGAPVIMISAFATTATRAAAMRLGAVEFLDKPIDETTLLNLVKKRATRVDVDSLRDTRLRSTTTDHAATRWMAVVLPIVLASHDVPTVGSWTRVTGHSRATLKQWCANAGLKARESLEFARALRLVIRYAGTRCDWFAVLEIVDERTLSKFLARAGLVDDGVLPALERFLDSQTFVHRRSLLDAVRSTLLAHGLPFRPDER